MSSNTEQLQKWALIAEITGALAIIFSLIYVGYELNDNTRALEQQSIQNRADTLNGPFLNSPLIPGILAKIKEIDGYEPIERLFIDRYNFTYEEAGIWARYLGQNWTGFEAEFVRNGPTQGLTDRIQLFMYFPDNYIMWDSDLMIQVADQAFIEYVNDIRSKPRSERISAYIQALEDNN